MLTDYAAVVRDLKVHLESKDSHGRRELHTVIGELEAKHSLKEGTIERALRVYGANLSDELINAGKSSNGRSADGVAANGQTADLS